MYMEIKLIEKNIHIQSQQKKGKEKLIHYKIRFY